MKEEITNFIQLHLNTPIPELALLLSKRKDLPKEYIINQINGRKRASQKFPFLLDFTNFTFPSIKAVAQSSSEITARYKADILKAESVIDLSGGMGIDSFFFSAFANYSHYVERDEELVRLGRLNFNTLGADNIEVHHASASSFLKDKISPVQLIYLDPDRRSTKEKAFKLADCEPNIANILAFIWQQTTYVMIKLSPLLDISQALLELPHCKEVHVISVQNDCKELLFLLQKNFTGEPIIKTVHYNRNRIEVFNFYLSEEKTILSIFDSPSNYLYEPNPSIMKAGAFKSIAARFNLTKLAPNTHLYSSTELIHNFPGRKLKIISINKPQRGIIEKANVVCRNFGQTTNQLKKKYAVKDGGSQFLFACELQNKKLAFILCELIE